MKKIRNLVVTAVVGFVLMFGSVVPIYGVDISEFSFEISAQLDGNFLNVVVDAGAPTPAGTGTFYVYFKSGEFEIKDPIGAKKFGVDAIEDGAVFSYGEITLMDWTSDHAGNTAKYYLKYDVSGISIANGSTLEMVGAGSKLGMAEGTCIAWDNDIFVKTGILASCTINGSSDQPASPTYTVSLDSPSVTTLEPTSEQPFTVPVILTSDAELSGAQLSLQCNPEVAKITGVTLAEGLTANGENSIATDGGSALISFFDNQQSAKEGLTVATVSMQPVAEGISSLSVTEGTAAMSGTTLEYPVTVPESPVTVEVKSQDQISASTYVSTPEGVVTLVKYTPGTAPAEGKVPAYDGTAMYQGPDHTWLCLVKCDPDKAKIGMTDGIAASVAHPQKGETSGSPADLNANDRVNIVDAQIAYDLATGKYTEIAPALTDTSIDLLHWLMADVNGDETVTAQDARAIQAFIHTQEWFKDAA